MPWELTLAEVGGAGLAERKLTRTVTIKDEDGYLYGVGKLISSCERDTQDIYHKGRMQISLSRYLIQYSFKYRVSYKIRAKPFVYA